MCELWLKALFHRSDLVLLIAMHFYGTSLVMSETREVYAMQPEKTDVAKVGLHNSFNEKNCRNTMKSINDGIYAFKACMLENDRILNRRRYQRDVRCSVVMKCHG